MFYSGDATPALSVDQGPWLLMQFMLYYVINSAVFHGICFVVWYNVLLHQQLIMLGWAVLLPDPC
jgi:hypothetical protein